MNKNVKDQTLGLDEYRDLMSMVIESHNWSNNRRIEILVKLNKLRELNRI